MNMIMHSFLNFCRGVWSIFYAPIILLAIHFILEFGFDLYDVLPWLDIPMHFLGGAIVAYAAARFFIFYEEKRSIAIFSPWMFLLLLVIFVSAIAVLWEFFEFGLEYFFHVKAQLSQADTMGDLFMGMFGASVAGGVIILFSQLGSAGETKKQTPP